MDEQEQAKQVLMQQFRRDQAESEAHPARNPRWRLGPRPLAWLLAIAVVVFVLAPFGFVFMYPRLFGPHDTLTAFCRDEGEGTSDAGDLVHHYAVAYGYLSQRAQQQVSLTAFTQASSDAHLLSCSVSHGIPINFGETRASLDVDYQLSGGSVGGSVTFILDEDRVWRIDSITPDLFHLSP
jgi:hypothetical protein